MTTLLTTQYKAPLTRPLTRVRDLMSGSGERASPICSSTISLSPLPSSTIGKLPEFKAAIRRYNSGEEDFTTISYPDRIGMVGHVCTTHNNDTMYVLFRHDSCMANYYENETLEDDDGDIYYGGRVLGGEVHQPQVYFMVVINKKTGKKTHQIVVSPFSVNRRTLPHTSTANSSEHRFFTGFCDGGYGSSLGAALKNDDLTEFVLMFSQFVYSGTNANDPYGSHYTDFVENATFSSLKYNIDTHAEATCVAHMMADDEVPFKMKRGRGSVSMKFSTQAVTLTYMNTYAAIQQGEQ